MGLRFRRSVKIMPGVRLNFSSGGISTTLGPRGASVNLGPRGAFLNMGLPGTGLSYRTQLSSSGTLSAEASPQPLYASRRSSARWSKQQERERIRSQAEGLHSQREAQLQELRDILRNRTRESVDWLEEYASLGPYQPRPFSPPQASFSADQLRQEVSRANPVQPWAMTMGAALACAALAPQVWIRVPAILLGLYFGYQAIQLSRLRPKAAEELLALREEEHAHAVEAARSEHERERADRAHRHEEEEALRTRLREAVVREDAEILASVLEVELSNEDLPLPLDFEIEFDGIRRVQLEVELPTMDAIPLTMSSVTKAGKFSERKMAQRDRVELYKDVCAGLALRLVHEVFRVLPFVEEVKLLGLLSLTDPATGQPSRRLALRLGTGRERFLSLTLDNVDPSEALQYLGGEMRPARDGTLRSLEAQVDQS